MGSKQACTTLVIAAIVAATSSSGAMQRQASGALPSAEREAIELLNARYALALGTCDAEKYAELFAEPDGWFASGSRGQVQGHAKLAEMIRSYNCMYSESGDAPPHAPRVEVPYRLEISAADGGAIGTIFVNGGFYTDVYVKTPRGWRFRSRTVITNREHAARLSAADFAAIRRLAERSGGPYADVYEQLSSGWRFKSAGVSVQPSTDGATGIAYLAKDGGRYEIRTCGPRLAGDSSRVFTSRHLPVAMQHYSCDDAAPLPDVPPSGDKRFARVSCRLRVSAPS